jgi:hypothetical protein
VPNSREGYTTDDNARALIVSTLLDEESRIAAAGVSESSLIAIWPFLMACLQFRYGRFRNFLGYDRKWLEDVGSDDSHGRALWSLGRCLGHSRNAGLRGAAGRLFEAAVPQRSRSPVRAPGRFAFWACKPIWTGSLETGPFRARAIRLRIGSSISMSAVTPRRGEWFEKSLSYSNARLSQALILAGWRSDNQRMIEAGMDSLKWLVAEQHRDDEGDLCAHRIQRILYRGK